MRTVHVDQICDAIAVLCWEACYHLPDDILAGFHRASETEKSPLGKSILDQLIENAQLASEENRPYCHDTGLTVVFAEVGQDVHIQGGSFTEAIHEGIRKGYKEGYLRNSIVGDPLLRNNTNDNTPGVIHTKLVPGEQIKFTVLPKGGGSENMSAMKFLLPGDGVGGVKKFVLDTIQAAGGRACPPLVVGVGIGGSFDKVTEIAKEAVLREVGAYHHEPHIAQLEKELLGEINKTGIGPQGLGGTSTALWVAVETYGCHITALPVAVNLQCHAARKKSCVI
ncbi:MULTISPECIES: fumarate hydratase [unclassified Paenibacillus]|uniref:fumarate hydratase n=1 Tax=unclassified Paenibacillus TaxID=185978 RepID=UPI001AE15563|nr:MULTISPECIES: fumarate hydratase [unclassified Paenibacillus]MBP1154163.1 fumarate hydratase subunit alpha [Paenibacillus sp. PvP091]MBP1170452.1 fumarate hydratase subunit alpha [Paenibacillus sp. PvR098]MBP2441480.1 fumarate hydratase subunit alpha [Paenibacillus sp. PvP052]